MDNVNPNAPNKALPLLPVQTTVASLVQSDFPVDVLHRHAVSIDLSAGPFNFNQSLHNFPGFDVAVLQHSMYVTLESIEITVDSFQAGTIVAAALTHDSEAPATLQGILRQKNHFSSRATDLTSGTVNHTLPFYNGMTKQLKPTPINGSYPCLMFFSNAIGVGVASVIFNYRRGGPVLTTSEWAIPLPPGGWRMADYPLVKDCEQIEATSQSEVLRWFDDSLKSMGWTRDDIAAFVVLVVRDEDDPDWDTFVVQVTWSSRFKIFSPGFVPVDWALVEPTGAVERFWQFPWTPRALAPATLKVTRSSLSDPNVTLGSTSSSAVRGRRGKNPKVPVPDTSASGPSTKPT